MTDFAVSNDGTRIAFDRLGEGPPVVLISGIFCTRTTTQALAEELAQRFSVINYDRRGRGESTDTAPYAVEREIEDLGALIAEAGGAASVYGHNLSRRSPRPAPRPPRTAPVPRSGPARRRAPASRAA